MLELEAALGRKTETPTFSPSPGQAVQCVLNLGLGEKRREKKQVARVMGLEGGGNQHGGP